MPPPIAVPIAIPTSLVIPTPPVASTVVNYAYCNNNVIQGTWQIITHATDGGVVNNIRGYAAGTIFELSNVGGDAWKGNFTVPNTSGSPRSIVTGLNASIRDSGGGYVDFQGISITTQEVGCG
jgi:hypothetical protein